MPLLKHYFCAFVTRNTDDGNVIGWTWDAVLPRRGSCSPDCTPSPTSSARAARPRSAGNTQVQFHFLLPFFNLIDFRWHLTGTRVRIEPKVQGRQVHHRIGAHDQGQRLGFLNKKKIFFGRDLGTIHSIGWKDNLCCIINATWRHWFTSNLFFYYT